MDHLDLHKILHDSQHGFRKRRSCESQLIVTIHEIATKMAKNTQVDVILLDFAKAFDKVPHKRLLLKLDHYGIRGSTYQWIESFLSDRHQCVVTGGTTSTYADVRSGVPQGTVLGPLLFLLFINDLPDNVESSDARLFADDCILFRAISTLADAQALQDDLLKLESWESDWQMSFNASKCLVIRIAPCKRMKKITFPYSLHQQVLKEEEASKYLGVTISNDLKWSRHVEMTATKANKTLGFIRRNFRQCTPKVKAAMYTTLVRPVLEYSNTAWSPNLRKDITLLEKTQRRAARFVTNNYTDRTPGTISRILRDLGWESLEERRRKASLVMMFRIRQGLVEISRQYLTPADARTRGNRIYQQRSMSSQHQHSFFPRTTTSWNALPDSITAADTLEQFKSLLGTTLP